MDPPLGRARLPIRGGTAVSRRQPKSLQRFEAVHLSWIVLVLAAIVCWGFGHRVSAEGPIDFARDIRPILSDNCFKCHGPGEESREARLRLDVREGTDQYQGIYSVVDAGDVANSELAARILSDEAELRMPPLESGRSLKVAEQDKLLKWIEQGANWSKHWAFIAPSHPEVPASPRAGPWAGATHPIDRFVAEKLSKTSLALSPAADREVLLRRVYLDVIGLPPSPDERRQFLADLRPEAFERLIDRLLASPHYGERWGRHWLDVARYADSDGYEKDKRRSNWFYRDWVIQALNDDLPYDQFIVQQIAGDLLPGAGQDEKVATGFLRNSMVNEEGGADPEQFRVEGLFDRMDAIGKAVLGLTISCAQCHSHKFDPLTHREYFAMLAYLNNCNERNIAVYTPNERTRIERIAAQTQALEDQLRHGDPDWRFRLANWVAAIQEQSLHWQILHVERVNFTGQKFRYLSDGSVLSQSFAPVKETNDFVADLPAGSYAAARLELMTHPELPRGGPGRSIYGSHTISEFECYYIDASGSQSKVNVASAEADFDVDPRPIGFPFADSRKSPDRRIVGPVQFAIDADEGTGWTTDTGPATRNQPRQAVFVFDEPIQAEAGAKLLFRMIQNHGGWNADDNQTNTAGRFRFAVTQQSMPRAEPVPATLESLIATSSEEWTEEDWGHLFAIWRSTQPQWEETNERIAALLGEYPEGVNQYTMEERTSPRTTHLMQRGDYLQPGEPVRPATPEFLHPFDSEGSNNRLAFARWLVDRRSPTAARAIVNRVWQSYFGTGLVETSEDLGSQAQPPSHPGLLDWLAVEFMENRWSLKWLHRCILTSRTYQQTSTSTSEHRSADPANRLLARGSRNRLDAEIVRDVALAAGGLLDRSIGGPSVYPPAPRFLFQPPASFGPKPWPTSERAGQYRRSVYVQAYRSTPYPPLQVFDAPNGNLSCTRRTRSNTPLQALTLLNEDQFVASAQGLAKRLLATSGASDQGRLTQAFHILLSRDPSEEEVKYVLDYLDRCRQELGVDHADGTKSKRGPSDEDNLDNRSLMGWTLVCRCLLNLDESITRE